MIVAELEICHSRPIAPTRRIGLGNRNLPVAPGTPGLGGVLLAGIVAHSVSKVEAKDREALTEMYQSIVASQPVSQPAVRHRYQSDLVGLATSTQFLINTDGRFSFDLDDSIARPVQLVLGALYAAESLDAKYRFEVLRAIEVAWFWEEALDLGFIDKVMNWRHSGKPGFGDVAAWNDPVNWALDQLDITDPVDILSRKVIQRQFRVCLREVHPDHGGEDSYASSAIQQLTDARDILLAKAS